MNNEIVKPDSDPKDIELQPYPNTIVPVAKAKEALEVVSTQNSIDVIGAMADIGRYTRGQGMKDVQRGAAMYSLLALNGALKHLNHNLDVLSKQRQTQKVMKQIADTTKSIAEITKQIDAHNKTMIVAEGTLAGLATVGDEPPPVNTAFQPGQQVGPGSTSIVAHHVTINEAQPAQPEPPKPA